MKNFKLTKTIILAQTNLEINIEKVFVSNGIEFFKTTDNQAFVLKSEFTNNERNCFVHGKIVYPALFNSLVEISK